MEEERSEIADAHESLSRRSFIAGFAASALAATGISVLAGCTGSSSAAGGAGDTSGAADYDITQTMQADVVVCGGGGCGCSAASRAAQLGLNTILVEKAAQTGGTTRFSEGLFAIGSHIQKSLGINISASDIIGKAMDYHHWIPDQDLYQTYFHASAGNIEWMEDLGIQFATATRMGASEQTWHVYKTDDSGEPGNLYVETWAKIVKKQGAQILTETPAVELLTKDGKVDGVICKSKDGYIQINAPVVIMATGGYSDSPDYIEKVAGHDPNRVMPMGAGTRTGDGMTMAKTADAAYAPYPGTVMFYGGNLPGIMFGTDLFAATSFEPLLWVNQDAKRFTNEMFSENNFSYSGNAQVKQKRVVSILTKAQMDSFVNEGSIFGCAQYIARGDKLPDLWKQYKEQVDAGNDAIYEADSIEALATKAGLDPSALKKTIDAYNGYCATGIDEEYGKDARYLLPVKEGPFYGFDLKVGYFTTVGGLKVNTQAQVLDDAGETIPGLYAGGCDAGGLYGDTYDVIICAGSQQGWAVHSGKVAAEDALRYLNR